MDSISKYLATMEYMTILPLYSFMTVVFVIVGSKFFSHRAKQKRIRMYKQTNVEQDRYLKAATEFRVRYPEVDTHDLVRLIQSEAEHMHNERITNHLI